MITHHAVPGMWEIEGLAQSGTFDAPAQLQAGGEALAGTRVN